MRLIISILAVASFASSEDYYGPPPSPPAHSQMYSHPVRYTPIKYQQEAEKPIYENHQYSDDQSSQMPYLNQQEKYILMTYQPESQSQNYNYGNQDMNDNKYTHIAEYIHSNKNVASNDGWIDNKEFSIEKNTVPEKQIEYVKPQVEYKAKTPKILEHQFHRNGHAYEYRYHTENGIQAQEVGEIGKASTVKGAYSYVGDDGKSYTVTYIADEHGFRPQGDHLPTPPPIPAEIAQALEKNAKDEANGISDDGQYHEHHQPQIDHSHHKTQHQEEYTIVDQNGYFH